MAADVLGDVRIGEIIDAFNAVDQDRDGIIGSRHLGEVLKILGENPSEGDLQEMINELDTNGTGTVEFSRFLMAMAKKAEEMEMEEGIREAFRVFDTDNNGLISCRELRGILMGLDEHLTEQECYQLVEMGDAEGVGQVNYEGFLHLMLSLSRAAGNK